MNVKQYIGNTLNFKLHIRENQWNKLLEKSEIDGVKAGIICWFIDKDITVYLPIEDLDLWRYSHKSYNIQKYIDWDGLYQDRIETVEIQGIKKKVFFDYNLEQFLEELIKYD